MFRPSSREPSRPYWTIGPFSPGTLSSKFCPSLVQTARHTHQTQALQTHSPTRPKQHPRQKHLCKNSGESPLSLLSGTFNFFYFFLTFKGKNLDVYVYASFLKNAFFFKVARNHPSHQVPEDRSRTGQVLAPDTS